MENDKDTLSLLERVQSVCLAEGCPEPIEWLAEVMSGKDPRADASPLFHLVSLLVQQNGDGVPSPEDWKEIRDMILLDPVYKPVRIEHTVSMRAAEKLIEHLHPKLKALDVSGVEAPKGVADLTEAEAEILKKKLDDQY
jgi:hypothetical protein